MKTILFFMLLICLPFFYLGCEQSTELLPPEDQQTQVEINLSQFGNLGPDAQYALWAVYDSSETEITEWLGSFTVDDQGNPSKEIFEINMGIIQKTVTLLISIEEADSIPPQASIYRIISAKLRANSATFSVGDDYLLGAELNQTNCSYQLVKKDDGDAIQGIWFMTGDTAKTAGLTLPDTPSRWVYQAYVIVNGDSLPTGNFVTSTGADRSNAYSDGLPTYPFPGENFLIDPETSADMNVDLRGAEVVVKIVHPVPDFARKPFKLEIFKGTIPADATVNTTYTLENYANDFPNGTASVLIKLFE